jgi:magnesium-dependent phosphatase 1
MLKLLRVQGPASSSFDSPSAARGRAEKAIDFFDNLQIFPGSKTRHFQYLHSETGIPYDEMLFFDDESRNRDVESLGVVMWLVRDGVTRHEVDEGVKSWRKRNKKVRDVQ